MGAIGIELPGPPESEARFNGPSEYCPHPEYWHSTDSQSTEIEVSDLIWGLVRAVQPELCVETGSFYGQTAERIAQALTQNGHGKMITIENDQHRAAGTANRLAPYPCASVHFGSSVDWEPEEIVGFAWFDSDTENRPVEFHRYYPWMRPGTIVGFHDTSPGKGNTKFQSKNDLRTEIGLIPQISVINLSTPRGVTIGVVK